MPQFWQKFLAALGTNPHPRHIAAPGWTVLPQLPQKTLRGGGGSAEFPGDGCDIVILGLRVVVRSKRTISAASGR